MGASHAALNCHRYWQVCHASEVCCRFCMIDFGVVNLIAGLLPFWAAGWQQGNCRRHSRCWQQQLTCCQSRPRWVVGYRLVLSRHAILRIRAACRLLEGLAMGLCIHLCGRSCDVSHADGSATAPATSYHTVLHISRPCGLWLAVRDCQPAVLCCRRTNVTERASPIRVQLV
jgi:hypothetical protein